MTLAGSAALRSAAGQERKRPKVAFFFTGDQRFDTIHVQGQAAKSRETLFFAYRDVQRAVRDDHFKLIEYNVGGKRTTQLFDLRNAPWELRNLAEDRRYGEDLHRLRCVLVDGRKKLKDESDFWRNFAS
jgi:arylsulfatase A-like enzyme